MRCGLFKYFCNVRTIVAIFIVVFGCEKLSAMDNSGFFRGIRPLGMGGAFAAVEDDSNSVFYNPAGLSSIHLVEFTPYNPLSEIGQKDRSDIQREGDSSYNEHFLTSGVLQKIFGEHRHVRVALDPGTGFTSGKFNSVASVMGSTSVGSNAFNRQNFEAHIADLTDVGGIAAAGFQVPFVRGLKFGTSAKYVFREKPEADVTSSTVASVDSEGESELNSGISVDLGVIYTLPWDGWFKANLAVVGQNVHEVETEDVFDFDDQWTFGISIEKKMAGIILTGAFDYIDVQDSAGEGDDTADSFNIGIEACIENLMALRAGLNQGSYSCGATLFLWSATLDLASYIEESGPYEAGLKDRRYVGQFFINW